MSKTYFIDIDGTILGHRGSLTNILLQVPNLCPNVVEKFNQWFNEGHKIIITTARPESMRKHTIRELEQFGLFYDQLVMGLNHGPRVVINDEKPDCKEMAVGITLKKDKGLGEVE